MTKSSASENKPIEVCSNLIPGTLIICGENQQYCSDKCEIVALRRLLKKERRWREDTLEALAKIIKLSGIDNKDANK